MQARSSEARQFLNKTDTHELFVSDYTLHSIGLLLFRCKQFEAFRHFLTDVAGSLRMAALEARELTGVIDAAAIFNLDFDDTCQYTTGEKYGLAIVSFDGDFDRTERGRKTPAQVS